MIINPDKSKAIIINKNGRLNETHVLNIGGQCIESDREVTLLGLNIDYKLNFGKHVSELCKRAAGRLNAITRLEHQHVLNSKSKKVLIESFILSCFNYCPLVWHFCSNESNKKMEKIQKRALRLLLNDTISSYDELLKKANMPYMKIKRLQQLAIEIFKTLNGLNPVYMQDIFIRNTTSESKKLYIPSHNAKTYGEKSLRILGPEIWNGLPEHFRTEDSIENFKILIKTWSGPTCKCNMCTYLNTM